MITVFVYNHAMFFAYKTVLVRDCDSMYANRFRNYIYGIPLDLDRQRSYIISLNNVGGGSDISDVKYMSDHAYIFSNHIPKKRTEFTVGGGHSLLWPKATTFLSHIRAYSQSEAVIVACGRRPQEWLSHEPGGMLS